MSERLEQAIENLDIPLDRRGLLDGFRLYDRLTAKLVEAVGEFDAAELWRDAGATSMTAWLRHLARRSAREAANFAKPAKLLRQLPATAQAYADGRLSTGQLQAIVANLSPKTAELFAEQEEDLLPSLVALSVREVSTVMQAWKSAAQDFLDEPGKPAPRRPTTPTANRLGPRRNVAPTPWWTSCASTSTTKTRLMGAATERISTSSSTTTSCWEARAAACSTGP